MRVLYEATVMSVVCGESPTLSEHRRGGPSFSPCQVWASFHGIQAIEDAITELKAPRGALEKHLEWESLEVMKTQSQRNTTSPPKLSRSGGHRY